MKCNYCGNEIQETDLKCSFCGTPAGETAPKAESVPSGQGGSDNMAAAGQTAPAPQKKKPAGKIAAIVLAAAVVAGGGIFAATRLLEKDPKEVVISAFENIYTEDQVKPMEELFGLSKFQENAASSQEAEMRFVMRGCSDGDVAQLAGGGIKVGTQYDKENKKGAGNLTLLYSGMDLANLNFYYGDETLMVSVPELSGKVFTLDLSEGLAERIKNSPTLGPILQYSDVNMEDMETFYREYTGWIQEKLEDGTAADPYGIGAALERYRKGCKAQEDFKEALTVEKAEKDTFEIDGKEVSCRGYEVNISKDSMISFLRTSSDFFLEDEELRENFLEYLQMSLRMLELAGNDLDGSSLYGMSAQEMLDKNYEEIKKSADEAIDLLDGVMNDVDMLVYVDKKGRLVSVDGDTSLTDEGDTIKIKFDLLLHGGSYLTQNAEGELEISPKNEDDAVAIKMTKHGDYDGKSLSGDISFEIRGGGEAIAIDFGGDYDSDDGDFTLSAEASSSGEKVIGFSAKGAVSELEKGSVIHVDFDEVKVDVPDEDNFFISFDGEYDLRPLSDEVEELEGEKLDVIQATEKDWQNVGMEMYMGILDLASQLGSLGN